MSNPQERFAERVVNMIMILRCIAEIIRYGEPVTAGSGSGDILFVPQRPYVVLGTLREQLLYPIWSDAISSEPPAEAGTSRQGPLHLHLRS